ncbi:MAG: competence/damage-inducible protein A [Pseudomonadota bacterium]
MHSNIAFLATGDEIVVGDILNTNAQSMANTLFHEQMYVTEHRIVRDDEANITKSILSLLESNDALIITGGLGPTTDDRTRFALAKALQKPLEHHEEVWQAILDRFQLRYGTKDNVPESNRQQALFPQGAEILANPNGTAAGCLCRFENKLIFMLPGPPHECLPMFLNYVLPVLQQKHFGQQFHFKNWIISGIGEGFIAEKLEAALVGLGCQTGYRASADRVIEFKLFADDAVTLNKGVEAVRAILTPYLSEHKT